MTLDAMKQVLILIVTMFPLSAATAQVTGISVETVLEHDGSIVGVPEGFTTYHIYANLTNELDFISAIYGDGLRPLSLQSTGQILQVPGGGLLGQEIIQQPFLTALPYDSWLTIDAMFFEDGVGTVNVAPSQGVDAFVDFENGEGFFINDPIGASWFSNFYCSNPENDLTDCAVDRIGFAGSDLKVLLAQVTTDGELSGIFNIQVFPNGIQTDALLQEGLHFNSSGKGCTMPTACNYNPTLTQDDGSCSWCECMRKSYPLTVEATPAVTAGLTTYRFYVNAQHPADRVDHVYGNNEASLIVNTPDGAFNSALNSTWSASGINPQFLALFPDLADDSYATIGLDGPASTSGIAGASDPSLVEDLNQPITSYFSTDGATSLESTTVTGASWFVLNTAANNLPDANGRVLIMQVTTAGAISGQINYRVAPLGVFESENLILATSEFNGAGVFNNFSDQAGGCTDVNAANFCTEANFDDGSCIYSYIFGGCTDSNACNYNPDASFDDESCAELDACGVCNGDETACTGCMDPAASNYSAENVFEDNDQCLYATTFNVDMTFLEASGATLNGATFFTEVFVSGPWCGWCAAQGYNELTDADGDGIYSVELTLSSGTIEYKYGIDGFTDQEQLVDDMSNGASCAPVTDFADYANRQIEAGAIAYDTFGTCTSHAYVVGCTDVTACNYDSEAWVDDGSCEVGDECGVCGGPGAIFECGCFDIPSGKCDCNGTEIDALGVCGGTCEEDADADGLCDDVDDCIGIVDENGECDGTLGCKGLSYELDTTFLSLDADHPLAALANHSVYNVYVEFTSPLDVLSALYSDVSTLGTPPMGIDAPCGCHSVGESPIIDNTINSAFYPVFPEFEFSTFWTIGMTSIDDEGVVPTASFIGDFDVCSGFNIDDGIIYVAGYQGAWASNAVAGEDRRVLIARVATCGEFSIQACVQAFIGGDHNNVQRWCPEEPLFVPFEGCTNYDACGVCDGPGAIYECGCGDIPVGDCDCDGNVLDVLGVCGGTCTVDDDNNGTCDDQEIYGCRYELAENYNPEATRDDDTCIFPCEGAVNINVFDWDEDYAVTVTDFLMMLSVYGDVDVDFDGIWDSGDLCVDTNACNYDVDPSEECAYIDVLGICGGGCEADEDSDGICDDVDTCVGIEDECGVCNGPGPTEVVIESITILYDSVYLPQLDEWYVYEFGADTTFTYTCAQFFGECGEPVSYQGYDYATVLIGEQCWFAENLRNEHYENGDAIPATLSDFDWQNTTSGAVAVYGEDAGCENYSPDIDACDPVQSLNEFGRLYNWYAVDDARGLCPSGWHVPTDGEWTVLTDHLGGESIAGGPMKTEYGWNGGGNGTNSSGFSGLPGGVRGNIGYVYYAGYNGVWWSSSPNGSNAWYRYLRSNNEDVNRSFDDPRNGLSVRCVRDAE